MVILITSRKGGVGKTTICANLGKAFARRGLSTVMVDGDFGVRCLDILCGVTDRVVFDLCDVACGRAELDRAVVSVDERLCMLASPTSDAAEGLTPERLAKLLTLLETRYDVVLLDAPRDSAPLFAKALTADVTTAATDGATADAVNDATKRANPDAVSPDSGKAVTGTGREVPRDAATPRECLALVVVNPYDTAVRAAELTGRELNSLGISDIRLLINAFDEREMRRGRQPSIIELIDRTSLRLGGAIPFDPTHNTCPTVVARSLVRAYSNLAARLCGESIPLLSGVGGINRRRLFGK